MPGQTPDRYVSYAVTTPANTPIASPLSTPLNLSGEHIETAQILIPAGHAGFTGIQLVDSGGVVLPFGNPGTWIIGDGRDLSFIVNMQAGTAMFWQTYNLGNFPHTHYVLLHVTDMPSTPLTLTSMPSVIGLKG